MTSYHAQKFNFFTNDSSLMSKKRQNLPMTTD